jgi:3-hydroxybutyryl-CoA dehydrogenase
VGEEPLAAIGIVGAGTMGAGIAQVALEAGHVVRIIDADPSAIEPARARIVEGLGRRARKANVDDASAWAAARIGRLDASSDLSELARASDVVIEAAIEDLAVKQTIFRRLNGAARPTTILATNTSALSVGAIASAVGHSERVLGLHFFNPAPLMRLVEVASAPATDPDVAEQAVALVERWGKTAVRCLDRPGFIVNRVNRPFTLEALRILRAGGGTIMAIDEAVTAAGFPMGPFGFMDLVGLDVNLAAATALYDALDRPARLRPSPIQEELVAAGSLGRKTGAGFYRYDDAGRARGPTDRFASPVLGSPLAPEEIEERIVLAIVNEAYRALGESVASPADIDLAMRLGANHPIGPIEWSERLGLTEVAASLDALAGEDDDAFRPALALLRAATGQGCC